ncbi:MAG: hypothetical protein ACOCV1_07020 [Bacillota bacterium]
MSIENKIKKYLIESSFKEKDGSNKNEKIYTFGVKGQPMTFHFTVGKGKVSTLLKNFPIEEDDIEGLGLGTNKQAFIVFKEDSGQPVKKSDFFTSVDEAAMDLVKNKLRGNTPIILFTLGEEIKEVIQGFKKAGKKKIGESGDLAMFK